MERDAPTKFVITTISVVTGCLVYFFQPRTDDEPSPSELAGFRLAIGTEFPLGSSGDEMTKTLELRGYQRFMTRVGKNEASTHQSGRHFFMGKLSRRHYAWENYCREPGEWVVTWTQDSEGRITELEAYHGVAFCI